MPAASGYEIRGNRTYRLDDEGNRQLLANFAATITEEIRYIDGNNVETTLIIEGKAPAPPKSDGKANDEDFTELKAVRVSANNFPGMTWVMQAWGVRAVIQPGSSVKEDLRTAIQLESQPKITTVYKCIGWTENDKGQRMYLHAKGAITAKGNNPAVKVQLPAELSRYDLTTAKGSHEGIFATLNLVEVCPPSIGWTLLAGTFAPLFGPVDFACHLAGRTGTFKSELISLFQSHFGPEMDARHLPASWSSTANALEAQAYYAQNAPMVVDDFVPTGTSYQVRNYHTTADKIIRAQGNQSGRARLTDTSNLQTTMYPRGIILSTGEDTPDGHSVRARMMILELSPGDIDPGKLTKAQNERANYSATTAALIQYLCSNPIDLEARTNQLRASNLSIGHTRTPSMLARLIATIEAVIAWMGQEAIGDKKAKKMTKDATAAILEAANRQQSYLESADPVDLMTATLRNIFAAGLGHARTLNGGVPLKPTLLGWTEEGGYSEIPQYKSHGPCIGWVSWDDDELYLEANMGFNAIKKSAGAELATTRQTLFKRLKDAGMLTRTDEQRQRNTVRVTCENHPRVVLSISLSQCLETSEVPQDTKQAETEPPVSQEPYNSDF